MLISPRLRLLGIVCSTAFALVLALGAMPGCSDRTGGPVFVQAADVFVNETAGPRYERYVREDAALSAEAKQTRIDELEAFRRAVESAKQAHAPPR